MFANSLIIKGSAFCCFNILAIALKCFLVIFYLYTYRVRALYKVYSNTSNASAKACNQTITATTATYNATITQPPEQIVNFSNFGICKADVHRWRCLQTQQRKVLDLVASWRPPNLLLSYVGLSSCGLDFFLYFSLSQPLDIHSIADI